MQSYSPPQARPTTANGSTTQPKILARACRFCRNRKTRCDTQKPRCGPCITHNRQCVYALEPPKKRPSTSMINALEEEKAALERCIIALKYASTEERSQTLDSILVSDGKVYLANAPSLGVVTNGPRLDIEANETSKQTPTESRGRATRDEEDGRDVCSSDEDCDPSSFLSLNERGQVNVYGPTSALHGSSPSKSMRSSEGESSEPLRYQLIANAALQRQKECQLSRLHTIAGEPYDLAMHLLELHWNRQHHTFLLTYRPAIMRDLVTGGPCCSEFLLNTIFACVSKFSDRVEVRDDPTDPKTAGSRFFSRCETLIATESLLSISSIPTLIGLLMLGSTFNARGQTSKGWLYTGYALRMVYDLGLHLDCKEVGGNAEDVEIRRRVFWGAFICDKLQSLYLGRPPTIQLRDAHVSRDFMDTIEENEPWTPYVDPKSPDAISRSSRTPPTPIYSVSTFQQLCLLSKLMTKIINRFYVIGATAENTRSHLQSVDDALSDWYRNLPRHLIFEPWSNESTDSSTVPPNVIILLTTFNALVILLHRPFIFDGHLRPTSFPADSWKRCSTAARNITSLATTYQKTYSLRRAPYLLSYALYVACTIHVRNTAAIESSRRQENTSALILSLKCLDQLTVPNAGVLGPAAIIRRLMTASAIPNPPDAMPDVHTPDSQDFDALCRVFPPSSPNFADYTQTTGFTGFGPDSYDSLNVLMDMYMPALDENFMNPYDGTN